MTMKSRSLFMLLKMMLKDQSLNRALWMERKPTASGIAKAMRTSQVHNFPYVSLCAIKSKRRKRARDSIDS